MTSSEFNQDIYDRVVAMVRKHTGYKDIKPDSRILQDLGTTGTDAYELMKALEEDFDVNMSQFEFEKHFGAELSFNPITWLGAFLFERDKLNKSGSGWKRIPIKVIDIYDAATTKRFPNLSNRLEE